MAQNKFYKFLIKTFFLIGIYYKWTVCFRIPPVNIPQYMASWAAVTLPGLIADDSSGTGNHERVQISNTASQAAWGKVALEWSFYIHQTFCNCWTSAVLSPCISCKWFKNDSIVDFEWSNTPERAWKAKFRLPVQILPFLHLSCLQVHTSLICWVYCKLQEANFVAGPLNIRILHK